MKNQPKTFGEILLEIIRLQKAMQKAESMQKPFEKMSNGRIGIVFCAN
jgi:hypothetical protein